MGDWGRGGLGEGLKLFVSEFVAIEISGDRGA